ncbi:MULTISPECIES: DUF916 and DUF3324 domain-containing protein [Latilactobacillus]|uniref:DUF916 and DUF3324 domain-containing protein n=1 Tax=Latilactobacillus TaxID=2767885 RepID=UPI0007E96A50|nr:DUF916 and DUF3324 domain-containing protein [Latilactobacillus curvatus]ANJ70112.1 hypothetical protein FBA2_09255 [Latilactobacillus curvatus]
MRRMKQRFGLLLAVVATFGLMLMVSHQPVQAEKVTYSVTPVYPDNQTDTELGYYDLKVTPGQKQEVGVRVQNSGTKPITVDVTPTTATTNENGLIDYTGTNTKRDSSLKYSFSDMMSGAQRVKVPANGEQTVTFDLTVPNESFKGLVLGGFYISQVPKSQVDQALERKGGATLTNQYSYILAAKLTESDEMVHPSLRLNKVKAGLINSHTAVLANVQNVKANSVGKMVVKGEIRKVGSNKVLYQNKRSDLEMAPNSNFNYGIDLKNQPLKAGKYNIKLRVTSNKGSWLLSKNFEITRQEVAKYNDKAVELPENNNWWLYVIIGIMIVIILLLIILLWRKSRKDKEQ